jgi:hypothetical protein
MDATSAHDRPRRDPSTQAKVLSKAVARAAAFLELPAKDLARVLGISESSVSRLRKGEYVLAPNRKEFELAQLFIRLFRNLDAITGSDDITSRSWLTSYNTALRGTPLELIQTVQGLANAVSYVDSRRAKI